MRLVDCDRMIGYGVQIGAAVAVVPAAITGLIASSRIISNPGLVVVNIFKGSSKDVFLVPVPFLWKVSYISAVAGGSLLAISLLAILALNAHNRHLAASQKP